LFTRATFVISFLFLYNQHKKLWKQVTREVVVFIKAEYSCVTRFLIDF
jgi:hypothetical protein